MKFSIRPCLCLHRQINKIYGLSLLISFTQLLSAQNIPLPEHPRPDFERSQWQNLNGSWQFEFDSLNVGINNRWFAGETPFSKKINVPFPWGSPLSGVADKADIAWYQREITLNPTWKGQRIFLTIGASDWETTVWLDGQLLGKHRGGYVPFSFELTDQVNFTKSQKLIIRVDDKRRDFTLYGKQGYGNARGIWQTVYLEARGQNYLDAVHFTPDIDRQSVQVTAYLPEAATQNMKISLNIKTETQAILKEQLIPQGKDQIRFEIPIPKPHLWTLDDPYLYEVEVALDTDKVKTYFGMRKISVTKLPGTDFPYVALNHEPIYLQLTLDQSYHPEGFYTFPSDQFIKEEILRSKSIGLNGIRPHIKVEIPRKLYWADKLGLLVMADLPNSWGEPEPKMQAEAEYTLRQMIRRDYNHPAIFSWIIFNETWGLRTSVEENGKKVNKYLPKTQNWVASMYYLAKSLDHTRLAEDNSICCGAGHTETDLNSFHDYLPGWAWEDHLRDLTQNSFPGSTFQFEAGFVQGTQPKINSECGNVWGYEGSTGDVDWSWDYHRMINTFRKYPEVAGWLYTEHHDVINEWNGYWRFDRSQKFTGLEEIFPGMTIKDFHAEVYLSTGNEICRTVEAGEQVNVPLYLSAMTGKNLGTELTMSWQLHHTNVLGENSLIDKNTRTIFSKPYAQEALAPLLVTMPEQSGLALLQLQLEDKQGKVLHRNIMHFEVLAGEKPAKTEIISLKPHQFSAQSWSKKQWQVLEGLKVNGAGKGYFEYSFDLPENIAPANAKEVYFMAELSAKELFVKDMQNKELGDVDYMLGGLVAPSSNPNAYPMSDEQMFPSAISILVNGEKTFSTSLPDDPADHRGVLSWHHQLKDRKLREAGSYGYLVKVAITKAMLDKAKSTGKLVIRLQTDDEGGIAIYGKSFGRYPLDPSIVFKF
ncbi:MAG: glycoside hydrolase family 2 TIM barrel-domain containing protein [Microscillaceae bacterium]|nr:glycoside hydrolase family 2 TIM barrel-domain containing protein [Microscillaceae bacterium]